MENINPIYPHRRVERIALPLPVRIEVKESAEVSWNEITRFQAISSCGAGFELHHQVKTGQLLLLTAPIPQKLRRYDYSEQQYRVWGVVRYCNPGQNGSDSYQIGVAFIGKYAPLSFHENPSNLYDLTNFTKEGLSELKESRTSSVQSVQNETPRNTRQKTPRYPIPYEVLLETLDQNKRTVASETTVSENVSLHGAAIFTSLNVELDEVVRVSFPTLNVSILAKVCNRRLGADGMPRLHLEFIDRKLPLEGIE